GRPAAAGPAVARHPQGRPASPAGDRGQTIITDVTQPLPSEAPPFLPQPGGGAISGRLAVAPGSLPLGTGSAGQLTVTAVGGPIRWAAGTSAVQVTLSSYSGSLGAGRSLVLTVALTREGDRGGSAVITVSAGSATAVVPVSWLPLPRHPRPSPTPSSPVPTPTRPTPSPT